MFIFRTFATTILALGVSITSMAKEPLTRKILFNTDWRFSLRADSNATTPYYNDASWREICLPHDWSIESRPDRLAPAGNDGGYYPTGIAWYRKTFNVPSSMKGEKVWLYFEGVYMNSSVYINGKMVGGHPYGYSSFYCDATDAIEPGRRNVVAVKVDNSHQKNCRWYSGSGIYRNVWLIHTPKLHIENWGVVVRTTKMTSMEAVVKVTTTVVNETARDQKLSVVAQTGSAKGISGEVALKPGERRDVTQQLIITHPKIWDVTTPYLYTAKVTVLSDGKPVDATYQTFGIRTISFSTNGFLLNGRKVKINGGCLHHDNGILGAAAFDRAEARKVKLMKSAGFNAIRTSHNPPSEAFLAACDKIGMLVVDEAFDGWREAKNTHDYSTLFDKWWKQDIDAMVLRDRNHPSIIAWSTGNEVIERKKIEIVTTAHKLTEEIHKLDNRPTTTALAAWDSDWEIYDPLAAQVNIVGYNYLIQKHAADHQRVPNRIMWQTESFPRDAFRNWTIVHDNDYVIGDFVWTGIDYLGESGIGRYWYDGQVPGESYQRPLWPCHAAYCGDIDLTGWRKPISHYRDLLWNDKEKLYLAVKEPDGYYGKINLGLWAVWPTWESWSWPHHEGKPIDIEIYSRYPLVRLYLDGRLIGEKQVSRATEMKATFTVNYSPGTLRAEGISNGKVMETRTLTTAGKPAAIRLQLENSSIEAGEGDLAFVQVEIVDKDGNICPNADTMLTAKVSGAGTLAAFGNANITDTNAYNATTHKAWKGRALLVVKSSKKTGKVTVSVSAKGLKAAKGIIKAEKNEQTNLSL